MIPEVLGWDLSAATWREKHKAIRYASAYVANSESTVRDFRRLFPEETDKPMVVVMPGLDPVIGALPVLLSWNAWKKVHVMSFNAFFTRFANGLPEADARAAYEKYVAPTPGKLYFDEVLNRGNAVDPLRRKVPLLLTAGGKDRTVTAGSVRGVYAKQKTSPAITALKYYPDRSHFLCSMPGWEQVADFVLDWLDNPRAGEL